MLQPGLRSANPVVNSGPNTRQDTKESIMKRQAVGISLAMLVLCPAMAAHAEEKIHELKASPTTVHRGFFDASLQPALTIDSGDIVRLWTTTGNPRYFESLGVPKEEIPPELFAALAGGPGGGRGEQSLSSL